MGHTSIDRKYTCVMEGNICNLDQLVKKLKKAGVYLKTNTPEEILIELYRFCGAEAWEELQGSFAIAIYNHKTDTLIALRDKYGIKQLYYRLDHSKIEISAELNALQTTTLNKEALYHYFSFNYVPEEMTPFQDVYHVPSGCVLTYKAEQGVEIKPYADLALIHGSSHSLVTPCRMRKVITESIYEQLQDIEEVGIRLKGELTDVALASIAKYATPRFKAFFLHCEGASQEEEKLIQQTVEDLEIELVYQKVTPNAYFQATKEALSHLNTPLADVEMPLEFLFLQTASKQVNTTLSLAGERELFGCDPLYKTRQRLEGLANRKSATRARLLKASEYTPNVLKQLLQQGCLPLPSHYPGYKALDLSVLLNWEETPWQQITDPLYEEISDLDWLEQMQTIDLNTKLKGHVLLQTNVLARANDIQIKLPFLDEEVIEMANDLTKVEKLGEGKQKPLLMEAFKHDVPEYVLHSKRKKPRVPLAKWLREELYEEVHRLVEDDLTKKWINVELAHQLLETHRLKKRDFSQEIWTMTVFILWLKRTS